MPIPPASRTPRLLLRNGSAILIADASASAAADATDTTRFKALGYRQTLLPAAKGGKANANGFRFRNGGLRAMARTFRGKVFIGGHDWSDPRARGGTIEDAYAEEMPGDVEMAIYYDIVAQAPWAIEGLKNGTIDRFSLGVQGEGEITCTVHGVPVWSIDECWCWPGEMVVNDDGAQVVAEWEWEGGIGLELSAVNVPAVDGTSIVDNSRRVALERHRVAFGQPPPAPSEELAILTQLCGRTKAWDRRLGARVSAGGVREGGSTPATAPITMASQHEARNTMDRALICQSLGLPVDATDEQIKAKMAALSASSSQVDVLRAQLADVNEQRARETDAAHVDSEIARVRSTRQVSDKVVATLRKVFTDHGRAAFDTNLANVEELAPAITTQRPPLQSDTKPAVTPGAGGPITATIAGEQDAFEANRGNEALGPIMRMCRVTPELVAKHGSRTFNVVPNLRELIDNTHARGDRMGTGR